LHQVGVLFDVPELSESGTPLRIILKDTEAVIHEDDFHSTN